MFKILGRLTLFALLVGCSTGPDFPVPIPGQPKKESKQGTSSLQSPNSAKAVEEGDQTAADEPQSTGGGFFIKRLECQYTDMGALDLLTRPFGCKLVDENGVMLKLPAQLKASFKIIDILGVDLELGGGIQRDASGKWHWVGEVPKLKAVGALVQALFEYDGQKINLEVAIKETIVP